MRRLLVVIAFLAVSCSPGAHNAAPTPSPTPVPTPGPPRGGEPAIARPPTVPTNQPNAVPGGVNGQLPITDLVQIAPGCLPSRPAAPSADALMKDAHAHGVALKGTDCYRPVERQANARTSACSGGNCACAGPPGHSMHGWGRAIDFEDAKGSVTSTRSASYLWLKANAARFGWNHPQWAETGPCPEAWHWEWVGDGGEKHLSPVRADVVGIVADGNGYALCTALAQVIARGPGLTAQSAPPQNVSRLVAGAASTSNGLWTVDALGDVRAYGEAKVLSRAGGELDPDITGIAATPSGNGYWLVTGAGRVLPFGDAQQFGSQGATHVIGIAATRTGKGYWLLSSGNVVYAFGDATPPQPVPPGVRIVAIAASAHGGYWLVSETGRVLAFGGAPYLGSLIAPTRLPVVGIAGTKSGYGYWVATASGGVFAFGDAPFDGTA